MEKKLPKHVAIIMDGNGRWAELRGKSRTSGHKVGSKNVDTIAEYAFRSGVKVLTLYAFSSENWQRPKEEVNGLMSLLKLYLKNYVKKALKNYVHLVISGDISVLPKEMQESIKKDEEITRANNEYTLNVCINYGGRQEIVNAVNKIIEKGEKVTEKSISENLYNAELGEPDLIIRTGGEKRLSNFLLYQGAYSELYFTDVLWPDFDGKEFDKALEEYSLRHRRFGKTDLQVNNL